MKKFLLPIFLFLFLLSANIFSQISILFSDMPQLGDTVSRNADTMTALNPGPAGANQSWIMTSATVHVTEVTKVLAPSATPYASSFTTSNISLTNDNQSYLYFNQSSNTSVIKGAAGDLLMTGCNITTPFSPDMLLHNFPRNYLSNFSDAYGIDVTIDGSCANQSSFDDVRFKRVSTVYDTTDGWGAITTPVGTYQCLRVKRVDFSTDSTWVKPFFPPNWTFVSAKKDTSYSYIWLAKEGKLAIAEMSFDSLDNPKKFIWSLIPPAGVPVLADFSSNTTSGCSPVMVQFSDLSTGNPTSWNWNFGNGNNSTLQNPGVTYVNPGTYTVSLTVSNGNSTDTKTSTITVFSNPTANFSYNPAGGNVPVNVTFADSSTGNAPIIQWLWDFGDGNSSNLQNPSHTYTAAGNYTVALIITDTNGCVSSIVKNNAINITVGIESPFSKSPFSIFPNPAFEKIYFSEVKENLSLVIFDSQGKSVGKFFLNENNSAVSISNFRNGIYFYLLKNANENISGAGKFAVDK